MSFHWRKFRPITTWPSRITRVTDQGCFPTAFCFESPLSARNLFVGDCFENAAHSECEWNSWSTRGAIFRYRFLLRPLRDEVGTRLAGAVQDQGTSTSWCAQNAGTFACNHNHNPHYRPTSYISRSAHHLQKQMQGSFRFVPPLHIVWSSWALTHTISGHLRPSPYFLRAFPTIAQGTRQSTLGLPATIVSLGYSGRSVMKGFRVFLDYEGGFGNCLPSSDLDPLAQGLVIFTDRSQPSCWPSLQTLPIASASRTVHMVPCFFQHSWFFWEGHLGGTARSLSTIPPARAAWEAAWMKKWPARLACRRHREGIDWMVETAGLCWYPGQTDVWTGVHELPCFFSCLHTTHSGSRRLCEVLSGGAQAMRCLPPQALTVTFTCESHPNGAREYLKRVSHRSGDTRAHLRQNDSHHMWRASLSCLLHLLKPCRTGSSSPCSPACSSSSSSKKTGTSGLSHQILLTVIPSSVAECCLVWLRSHLITSFLLPSSSFLPSFFFPPLPSSSCSSLLFLLASSVAPTEATHCAA